MAEAAKIKVTEDMVEAGVSAYFVSRVEDQVETMEDCRATVAAILLAGLSADPQSC